MKNNLFKKSMSVFLAVLMIMSCWVWIPGEHHLHAEAGTISANVTTSFTLSPEGNRGATDWTRLALTGEGGSGGTSVILFRFSNADLKRLEGIDAINLQFYAYSCPDRLTHKSNTPVNADVYYITKNQSFVSNQGSNKNANVGDSNHSVLGSNYGGTNVQNSAKSYFGLSDTTKVVSFEQPAINGNDSANRNGAVNVTCNVTDIVKSKANSGEDLSFIVMLRSAYSCSSSAGWSDIYINSDTIALSGYDGAYGMPEVGLGNNLDGQMKTTLDSTITVKYPTKMYIDKSEDLSDAGYSINVSCNGNNRMIVFPTMWGGQESDTNGNFAADRSNYDAALKGQNTIINNFDNYGIRLTGAGKFANETTDSEYTTCLLCDNASQYLSSGNNYALQGKPKSTGTYRYYLTGYYNTSSANPRLTYMGGGGTTYLSNTNYISGNVDFTIYVYDKSALNTVINNANSILNDSTSKGKYTTASLNNLQNVLNNNKGVLSTREVTQTQIDSAKDNIQAAIDALTQYGLTFDNLFDYSKFTIGGSLTVNERTDTGFTVTSTAADGNTGFSDYIAVEPGKTYVFSADVEFTQSSGGYDMYVHTVNANKEGVQDSDVDTSNGAHPESPVYYSITGQTTNKTPYIRFTAGDNTHYIRIRFDANAVGNKLTVNNIRVYCESDLSDVSFVPTKMYKKGEVLGNTLPVPTRTGYTFNGWYLADGTLVANAYGTVATDDLKNFKMDNSYSLVSKWTVNQYTITFNTDGGSTIDPITQDYGTAVTAPANPTKAGYKFAGWDMEIPTTMPAKNMTFKALWVEDTFTIKFVNYDGTVLQEGKVNSGETPAYTGSTPTKPSTTQYSYSFVGWTPEITEVTGEATYTAQFDSTVNSYTITFVNHDGTELQKVEVPYGSTPAYTGETPTKASTAQYSYTFTGWEPTITSVAGNATYTAQFGENTRSYTVTWKNHDGTILETDENVPYGTTPAYNGATPTKAADVQYSYTHNGWSPEVTAVAGDVTYTAQFKEWTNQYEIKFVNEDGTVLQSGYVKYGETPSYTGATPTKAADAEYTYTFTGWTPSIKAVDGTATYEATYNKAVNEYTITWVDGDGNTLKTDSVAYGATPSYTGATPTKTATTQYTYTFNNKWSPSIASVTGNATYTAQFDSTVNSYTVTWKNHDGTILETDTVEYGEMPSYDGAAPTKAGNAQYSYAFAGWDNEIATVTGDVTYTATYTESTNSYTVIWANEDGTVLEKDENVLYGSVPSYDGATPTKAATAQYTYTYKSWDKAISEVTGDVTYTAVYDSVVNEYTITFKNENGDVLQSGLVKYGETPSYTGATPTKTATAQYTYTFAGWTPAVTAVTGEAEYTATYTSTVNKYTVKFVNEDGTEIQSGEVAYGETPSYTGATPTKAADAQYTYTFAGWTPAVTAVTGVATYTATYTSTVNEYTVKFVDEDGTTVLDTQTLEYGQVPVYGGTTPTKSATAEYTYIFDKWSPAITSVTGNATYTATYKATKNSYKVDFVDEDGTTVLYTNNFKYGTEPVFAGAEPTKEATAQYSYTFAGWTPKVVAVTGNATYKATYTESVRKYAVTWVDGDGKTLKTDSVAYGETPEYTGETPTKASTAQYTYTFNGWGEIAKVTGDATYTARFDSTVNRYTITWKNDDGSTIDTTTVEYGTVPAHADATKAATAEYTYTFAGWDPAVAAVTGDAEYTATYTATKNSYTITWLNDDDSLIDTTTVEYGVVPTHAAASKAETAEYTYTFAGWSPEVVAVTGNATYKATFTAEKRSYTITWKNDDGTTIDTTTVKYGEVPTHDDATKAATAQYTYTFAGWSPAVVAVTGDASYTATYSTTVNKYVVKFVDEDGTELQSSEVAYGETPAYTGATPTKAATAQYTYTFAGWDAEITPVTGEATYKATYSNTTNEYTVTFENEDGTVLQSGKVAYGETPAYTGETPTKSADAQYTYTFAGWTPSIDEVTGDATYTATYSSTVNEYTIKFVDEDGTELQSSEVAYGETPVYAGEEPTKEATAQYTYTFAGWDAEITPVTGEATYKATYSNTTNEYTVTFENEDGTVLQTGKVAYGETPAYTGETPTKEATAQYTYTFAGWTPEVVAVTGEAIYTATYSPAVNSYTITFVMADKTETTVDYEYGATPVAPENTENKYNADGHFSYEWPEIADVTGDATYSEIENKADHTPAEAVTENEVKVTCTVDGSYDTVIYCSVDACKKELSRVTTTVAASGHTAGEAETENEIEATCTEDGSYDTVVYCSVCTAEISRETTTVDALGHDEISHEAQAATCTAVGWDEYVTCSRCDYTTKVEIPKKGHTEVPGEYVAPTCATEGKEGATVCSVCGEVLKEGSTIAKLDHTFPEVPTSVIPATCQYDKVYVYKCKFCTETKREGGGEISDGPHMHVIELGTIEATCETEGVRSFVCTDCDAQVKTEIIPALGHADENGDGTCDNCSGTYVDSDEGQKVCGCICHKESGFMQFLYKIVRFFWKLFKMNKSCSCGTVHY